MRFLGIGETGDLGDLYLSLLREGHDVRIAITDPYARGTLRGLCPRVEDWRSELDWVREAGEDGVILFEAVSDGLGALQDCLRQKGYNVIGGSAYGDRLENDRHYAQEVLAELGFPRGHVWWFDDYEAARRFIIERPARYVLKYEGADHEANRTYAGQSWHGDDVAQLLRVFASSGRPPATFILMEFVEGIEMGVGAYFNGERFLRPACLDWEHKRFFTGDLGELTGEMGTVVTYQRTARFFDRTLAKLEGRLREAGHVGYVNLNTIVNAQGVWPLEFTCRFGYPGFAVLAPLQDIGWGDLFSRMVSRNTRSLPTRPGFCVGVVITTPPFPYTRRQVDEPVGLPVRIDPEVEPRHVHYGEVGLGPSDQLVTTGLYGWTLVVTGEGETIAAAKSQAYGHVRCVAIPNARYRLDIGDRLIAGDYKAVEALGHFNHAGAMDSSTQ